MRAAILGLMLVASPAAAAEPVDLECVLNEAEGPNPLSLTLNEAAGSASYYWRNTDTKVKKSAVFLADRVTFDSFTVDRSTLKITRQNSGTMITVLKMPPTTEGQCKIVKVDRAF